MRIANPHPDEPQPTSSLKVLWRISKTLLIVAIMLRLGALNVLTIVNEQAHAAGFNFLKSVLAPFVTEASLSHFLSHSPTQKYKAIEARNVELKRFSAMRSDTAKRVSIRIGRRVVANAVKNVSSFAVEVIPVVGVTAIVAITASDIYDDCQTLKDLNELNITFDHEKEDVTTVCGMKAPSLN
jgi:hypothetical protein